MLRTLSLSLLIAGCATSSSGRVNVGATLAAWGGLAVIGGIGYAAQTCEYDDVTCTEPDPSVAAGSIIVGAGLLVAGGVAHAIESD